MSVPQVRHPHVGWRPGRFPVPAHLVPLGFAAVRECAMANEGRRMRLTARNGVTTVGLVGRWRTKLNDEPTLDGKLIGGEYDSIVYVEVMAENGRYRQVLP